MRTGIKIILIIVAFLIGGMLISICKATMENTQGGVPIVVIIVFAMIAGIRAIWKYKPVENSNNSEIQKQEEDIHTLDKK
jgi:uncharacterized membrane protein YqjE